MAGQNLAASSFTQLRYAIESTWGETPTTGNAVNLRMTGETLDFNLTKDSSKEINPSRQVRSLADTNASAQGSVNIELSYKEYDPFIAALMGASWSAYGTNGLSAATDVTLAKAVGGHDTLTAGTATSGADLWNFKSGAYVKVVDTTGNHKPVFGQLDADATSTVLSFPAGTFDQTWSAGDLSVSIGYGAVKIGNNNGSFTLEKEFTDVEQFFSYRGMKVSKMDLSFQTGSFITGSFDFMGRDGQRTDASVLPGVPVASQNYRSMSGVDGVADVRVNGLPVEDTYDTYVKELTITFDNQMEGLQALGYLGAVQIMAKEIQLTGGMQLYLADGELYDAFVESVTQGFSFVAKDPDGNGYAFVFDKIEFSSMPVQASANGQSVMLDSKWTALMGDTSGNSLTIYRL